jgi:iron-sulfur cluster insertion protein
MDTATKHVDITDAAARQILVILADEPTGAVMRVGVDGGGCSGFQYNFSVDPAPTAEDLVFERAGAKIVVDPTSLDYIAGCKLDFVDDLMGQSFRVDNPNATASCGCGTSFSI